MLPVKALKTTKNRVTKPFFGLTTRHKKRAADGNRTRQKMAETPVSIGFLFPRATGRATS